MRAGRRGGSEVYKASQARDVRAAVGSRYGTVLAAEGHLLDLCEPEDANPAWKRWSTELLRPDGLYGTKPAAGGNKAAKLKAIRAALKTADRVWLATDCDREGQLIGQEILEHCRYRGDAMRVLFTAQDPETIRTAFRRARPNAEHARLYDAAVMSLRRGRAFGEEAGRQWAGSRPRRRRPECGRCRLSSLQVFQRFSAGEPRERRNVCSDVAPDLARIGPRIVAKRPTHRLLHEELPVAHASPDTVVQQR